MNKLPHVSKPYLAYRKVGKLNIRMGNHIGKDSVSRTMLRRILSPEDVNTYCMKKGSTVESVWDKLS